MRWVSVSVKSSFRFLVRLICSRFGQLTLLFLLTDHLLELGPLYGGHQLGGSVQPCSLQTTTTSTWIRSSISLVVVRSKSYSYDHKHAVEQYRNREDGRYEQAVAVEVLLAREQSPVLRRQRVDRLGEVNQTHCNDGRTNRDIFFMFPLSYL